MSDLQSRIGPKLGHDGIYPNKVWIRPGFENNNSPKAHVNQWNKRKRSSGYDSDVSSHEEDSPEGHKKSLISRLGMNKEEEYTEPPVRPKSLLERLVEPIDVDADSFFAHHSISVPPSPTSSQENETSPNPTEGRNQVLSMESSHEPSGGDVDRETQLMAKHNKRSFCAPTSRSAHHDENRSTIETAQTTRTELTTGTHTEPISSEKRPSHVPNENPRPVSIPLSEPSTEPLTSAAIPLAFSSSQQSLSEGEVVDHPPRSLVSQGPSSIEEGEVQSDPLSIAKSPSVNTAVLSDSVLSAFAQKATKEIGNDLRARIYPPPPSPISAPGPPSRNSPPPRASGSHPSAGPSTSAYTPPAHSPVIPPSMASISGRSKAHTLTVLDPQLMAANTNGLVISAFDPRFNKPSIRYTPSPPHTDDESTPQPSKPPPSKTVQHENPRPRTPPRQPPDGQPPQNEGTSLLRSPYHRDKTPTPTHESSSRQESYHPEQLSLRENPSRRDSYAYAHTHEQQQSPALHPAAVAVRSPVLSPPPRLLSRAPPTAPAALRNKTTPRKAWDDRVGPHGNHMRRHSGDTMRFGVERSPRVQSPLRSPVRSPLRSPVRSPVRLPAISPSAHHRRPHRVEIDEEETGDAQREEHHRHRCHHKDGRDDTRYREQHERRSASPPPRKAYKPHMEGRRRSRSRSLSRSLSRSRSLSQRAEKALSPHRHKHKYLRTRSRSRSLERVGSESSSMSISNRSSIGVGVGSGTRRIQEKHPPLFWRAKPGLDELGIIKWDFDIDQETAKKLDLKSKQDGLNPSPGLSVSSDKRRRMSLRLACFPRDMVDSCINVLENGQQLTSETSPATHYWPTYGHLIVKVNEELPDTHGKTWLPDKLKPQDPPISLEHVIYEGKNSLELIQLSNMADKVFLLFAQERPSVPDKDTDFAPLANSIAVNGPIRIMPAEIITMPLLD